MTEVSEVSICNNALTLLGDKTITALDENSNQGRACNANYNNVRDYVQRAHRWNSCMELANIASDATSPTWGWTNRFLLPVDPWCLRVLEIQGLEMEEWEVFGRYLQCDNSSVNMKYLARVTDPMLMDSMLTQCIAARLAYQIAYRLTSDKGEQDRMIGIYKDNLKDSRSIDGQEGAMPVVESSTFTDVRL
tara:strand:- start:475 stop:1047 length:573 start_codon:yes stop_codon:yes gene_type:complete